ncbi:MAG: SCO1664 family protein [Actinomycetota bacterium]|nr:SCO1664 family protein [Actinomycetota bacterium]
MHQDQRAQATLTLLTEGEVELKGRMPWSTNQTFLVELTRGDEALLGVYKPGRGERPLWDFPGGLYRREVAAWVLSELLGWGLVPETVLRDGPLGEGSVQRFVEADFTQHYFTLYEDPSHHDALRALCVFDILANNTDRKSGHCLLAEGRIWAIDNGLCFHPSPKVRTVIWEFGGEAIPDDLLADVERLLARLPGGLVALVGPAELAAVTRRAEWLLRTGVFPVPDPLGHCYPWPLV